MVVFSYRSKRGAHDSLYDSNVLLVDLSHGGQSRPSALCLLLAECLLLARSV